MLISLLAGIVAAVCYGVAVVMQAIAVRQASTRDAGGEGGVDPGLLPRMLRQWIFVASILLDLLGFAAQLLALRELPLFAVQAMVAANLAVAAVGAAVLLRATLSRREWLAIGGVIAGIGLLGSSAGAEGAVRTGMPFRVALVIAVGVMVLAGLVAARVRGTSGGRAPARTLLLGTVAGLGYGIVGVAARVIPAFGPLALLKDPAAYAVVAGGIIAFAFYATALEGGSVAVATAAVVLTETLPPAVVGVVFLGDATRPGFVPVAVVGFVLAVASALLLGRFGEGDRIAAETGNPAAGGDPAGRSAEQLMLRWWSVDLRPWAVPSLTTGVSFWPLHRRSLSMLIPSIFSSLVASPPAWGRA